MARIEIDPNYSSPTFSRATAATDIFKKEDVQQLAAALSTHDHSTGKGLALSAAAIGSGVITSAMIADGTITAVDLAAGAVSQSAIALGSASSPSTTSASFVDMPDMVVSMTTTGGNVLLHFVGAMLTGTANQQALVQFGLDGVSGGFAAVTQSPTPNTLQIMSTIGLLALAAGPHVFKMQWATTGGTLTSNGVQRYLVIMELKR